MASDNAFSPPPAPAPPLPRGECCGGCRGGSRMVRYHNTSMSGALSPPLVVVAVGGWPLFFLAAAAAASPQCACPLPPLELAPSARRLEGASGAVGSGCGEGCSSGCRERYRAVVVEASQAGRLLRVQHPMPGRPHRWVLSDVTGQVCPPSIVPPPPRSAHGPHFFPVISRSFPHFPLGVANQQL